MSHELPRKTLKVAKPNVPGGNYVPKFCLPDDSWGFDKNMKERIQNIEKEDLPAGFSMEGWRGSKGDDSSMINKFIDHENLDDTPCMDLYYGQMRGYDTLQKLVYLVTEGRGLGRNSEFGGPWNIPSVNACEFLLRDMANNNSELLTTGLPECIKWTAPWKLTNGDLLDLFLGGIEEYYCFVLRRCGEVTSPLLIINSSAG